MLKQNKNNTYFNQDQVSSEDANIYDQCSQSQKDASNNCSYTYTYSGANSNSRYNHNYNDISQTQAQTHKNQKHPIPNSTNKYSVIQNDDIRKIYKNMNIQSKKKANKNSQRNSKLSCSRSKSKQHELQRNRSKSRSSSKSYCQAGCLRGSAVSLSFSITKPKPQKTPKQQTHQKLSLKANNQKQQKLYKAIQLFYDNLSKMSLDLLYNSNSNTSMDSRSNDNVNVNGNCNSNCTNTINGNTRICANMTQWLEEQNQTCRRLYKQLINLAQNKTDKSKQFRNDKQNKQNVNMANNANYMQQCRQLEYYTAKLGTIEGILTNIHDNAAKLSDLNKVQIQRYYSSSSIGSKTYQQHNQASPSITITTSNHKPTDNIQKYQNMQQQQNSIQSNKQKHIQKQKYILDNQTPTSNINRPYNYNQYQNQNQNQNTVSITNKSSSSCTPISISIPIAISHGNHKNSNNQKKVMDNNVSKNAIIKQCTDTVPISMHMSVVSDAGQSMENRRTRHHSKWHKYINDNKNNHNSQKIEEKYKKQQSLYQIADIQNNMLPQKQQLKENENKKTMDEKYNDMVNKFNKNIEQLGNTKTNQDNKKIKNNNKNKNRNMQKQNEYNILKMITCRTEQSPDPALFTKKSKQKYSHPQSNKLNLPNNLLLLYHIKSTYNATQQQQQQQQEQQQQQSVSDVKQSNNYDTNTNNNNNNKNIKINNIQYKNYPQTKRTINSSPLQQNSMQRPKQSHHQKQKQKKIKSFERNENYGGYLEQLSQMVAKSVGNNGIGHSSSDQKNQDIMKLLASIINIKNKAIQKQQNNQQPFHKIRTKSPKATPNSSYQQNSPQSSSSSSCYPPSPSPSPCPTHQSKCIPLSTLSPLLTHLSTLSNLHKQTQQKLQQALQSAQQNQQIVQLYKEQHIKLNQSYMFGQERIKNLQAEIQRRDALIRDDRETLRMEVKKIGDAGVDVKQAWGEVRQLQAKNRALHQQIRQLQANIQGVKRQFGDQVRMMKKRQKVVIEKMQIYKQKYYQLLHENQLRKIINTSQNNIYNQTQRNTSKQIPNKLTANKNKNRSIAHHLQQYQYIYNNNEQNENENEQQYNRNTNLYKNERQSTNKINSNNKIQRNYINNIEDNQYVQQRSEERSHTESRDQNKQIWNIIKQNKVIASTSSIQPIYHQIQNQNRQSHNIHSNVSHNFDHDVDYDYESSHSHSYNRNHNNNNNYNNNHNNNDNKNNNKNKNNFINMDILYTDRNHSNINYSQNQQTTPTH